MWAMHYRGFVFVDEPTEEAVEVVMAGYGGGHKWDWYRCGGREDGYLQGDDEMSRRETHDGFNFDAANKSVVRNSCKVRDLPADRRKVYFFLTARGGWTEREFFVGGYPTGRFENNLLFQAQLELAIAENPDKWIVVVDAHN
jgi:hypothetical protein